MSEGLGDVFILCNQATTITQEVTLKEIIEEYNLNYFPIKEKRGLGYEIQEEKLFKNFWRKDLDRLFENFNDLNFYFNKKSFMKIWEDFKNNKNNETESISKMISIQILLQGH